MSPSRGVAIPGARDEGGDGGERWRVALHSANSDAGASLSASVQDGFFSGSLRRQSTEPGYSHSTFGSLGHGAWLSSSPHPNMRAFPQRPPLHRSPSLQGTPSAGFSGLHAHEEALEAAEVGEAAGSPAAAPGSPPGVSPAGTAGTALSRAALARGATTPAAAAAAPASPLSPRSSGALAGGAASSLRTSFEGQAGQRAQRWYLPAGGTATEASEAAEPLLSGFSQELPVGTPQSINPYGAGTPASNKTAAAAAAAVAGRSGSAAPGELVAVARDPQGQDRSTELSRALVFGLINSVATIPALVAYAAIVFKDPIYAPYLDQLCKFFFLSSAVHQAVFCVLSSLPFAVGQVQDVGLIFLSAMATSVAAICWEAGRDAATALGTSLLTMSVATFFTGACTLLVARYKLGQLVQYLPLPVIGGYLSFVGYFCVASGIGLGVSQDIGSIASWANLFNADALTKLVPTLLSCFAMIATLEHFSHPLALPTVLAAINVLFHAVRLALGVTLEQAMDANWVIRPAEGREPFWELWGLFNISDLQLSGIYFPAMAQQVVKTLGLALVVIFGSAMDIAAIQQDTPQKIDFDRELTTVAVSNMATGVAGCGYTGSYIFSQTIFTMRAGVYSRWNGVVVAASELVMFALPFAGGWGWAGQRNTHAN
jgi:SulP family sulfate permease